MTRTLTKEQIDAIKVELSQFGLDVRPMPKPRVAKTVGQVLAKSKWYKRPSLAALGKPYGPSMQFVKVRYSFNRKTRKYTEIGFDA